MRDYEDFAAHMRARWTPLVRSLVVLGCPVDEVEDVAQVTLARCYAGWGVAPVLPR